MTTDAPGSDGGRTGRSDAPATITVLICDDDPRLCHALRELIETQPGLSLAAIAHDGPQAKRLARRHRPTVAIVDVRMPGGGPQTVRAIREQSPGTGILTFTAHDDPGPIKEMEEAGARICLLKSASIAQILDALHDVAAHPSDE